MNENLKLIPNTFNDVWDFIIDEQIATESECRLLCIINGNKIESLNDIIEVRTTYRDCEHYITMVGIYPDKYYIQNGLELDIKLNKI